jgi:hypothetical protein
MQGSPFRFYCSEFRFFDQSLTFIFLNLKPKSPTFQTEIRFPVSSENGKKYINFGLSDRNGEPCVHAVCHPVERMEGPQRHACGDANPGLVRACIMLPCRPVLARPGRWVVHDGRARPVR